MADRRNPLPVRLPLTAATALTLILSACSGDPGQGGGREETVAQAEPEEAVSAQPVVPATAFDTSQRITFNRTDPANDAGALPVALDGGLVHYTSEEGIIAHDALSDEHLWTVPTSFPVDAEEPMHSVSLVETPEGPVVFGSFWTRVPGAGTTRASWQWEVLAVEAGTGELLWHTEEAVDSAPSWAPRVLGVDDGAVIVRTRGTTALDARTGQVLWEEDELIPHMAAHGVVVGASGLPSKLHGLSMDDGRELWTAWERQDIDESAEESDERFLAMIDEGRTSGELAEALAELNGYVLPGPNHGYQTSDTVYPLEGGRFAVRALYVTHDVTTQIEGAHPHPSATPQTVLVMDAGTGRIESSLDYSPEFGEWAAESQRRWGETDCRDDGAGALVCWGRTTPNISYQVVVAMDSATGDVRWIEEFGTGTPRAEIEPRGAWQGSLYAEAQGRPVVIDLTDASDLETDPGAAPGTTNGVLAVEYGDNGFSVVPVVG